MTTTHTVKQGETLSRIAKQYKHSSWKSIYYHPKNADFQKLRPDPNVLYPGDEIFIPDPEPTIMSVTTSQQHVFCVKTEREFFRLKIETGEGRSLSGKRARLKIAGQEFDVIMDDSGMINVELPNNYTNDGSLDIFMDSQTTEPSHSFELKLGHLDPIDTMSGVQARCNMLGHDCGEVDGQMGEKTRAGVLSFQTQYGLPGDGEINTETRTKLKEVFGS